MTTPAPTTTATPQILRVPCQIAQVPVAKDFVMDIARAANIPEELSFKLELALDEAVINAIDHGSACKAEMEVELTVISESDRLIVLIKDYGGKPFNPEYFEKIAFKKTWGEGGRGIQLISNLMDEVMYLFNPGYCTLLAMTLYTDPALRKDEPPPEMPDLSMFDAL